MAEEEYREKEIKKRIALGEYPHGSTHVPGIDPIPGGGGSGGADIKSGTKAAAIGSNSVTFNTPFSSIPQVVLTVQDAIQLRDCLYKVTAVSTTGFSFEVDLAATYAWNSYRCGRPLRM